LLSIFAAGFVLAAVLFNVSPLTAHDAKIVIGQIQPFVIDIAQAVPVQVSVPLSGSTATTMTLPLTVTVNLRVSIDTASRTATVETLPAPLPEVSVVQTGHEQIDDLGLSYELILDSNELEITEWTVYESNNGWLSFSGEVAISADADTFDEIECVVRAYKNGKLVKVEEIVNVGFRLEPGGTNRFDAGITVQPSDIDSYTVEFTVVR